MGLDSNFQRHVNSQLIFKWVSPIRHFWEKTGFKEFPSQTLSVWLQDCQYIILTDHSCYALLREPAILCEKDSAQNRCFRVWLCLGVSGTLWEYLSLKNLQVLHCYKRVFCECHLNRHEKWIPRTRERTSGQRKKSETAHLIGQRQTGGNHFISSLEDSFARESIHKTRKHFRLIRGFFWRLLQAVKHNKWARKR